MRRRTGRSGTCFMEPVLTCTQSAESAGMLSNLFSETADFAYTGTEICGRIEKDDTGEQERLRTKLPWQERHLCMEKRATGNTGGTKHHEQTR